MEMKFTKSDALTFGIGLLAGVTLAGRRWCHEPNSAWTEVIG